MASSDSEHVKPSRPMQTHVHNTWYILTWVKKMCDCACDINDVECRQWRQTLLDGNLFTRYLTCETCDHFWYKKIHSPWPRKDSLFSRTILCTRCDHSMVGPSLATHSRTSTITFKVSCTRALSRIAVRV